MLPTRFKNDRWKNRKFRLDWILENITLRLRKLSPTASNWTGMSSMHRPNEFTACHRTKFSLASLKIAFQMTSCRQSNVILSFQMKSLRQSKQRLLRKQNWCRFVNPNDVASTNQVAYSCGQHVSKQFLLSESRQSRYANCNRQSVY